MSAAKKYPCPICGTKYPSAKLANHCTMPICREVNNVPASVAKEWRIQTMVACLIGVIAENYERTDDKDHTGMCERLHKHLGNVYSGLRSNYPVPLSFSRRHRDALENIVFRVWPRNSEQQSVHVIETVLMLVEDVRDHLRGRVKERTPWNWLRLALVACIRQTDTAEVFRGCDGSDEAYEALRAFIWQQGAQSANLPRVWYADNRFAVVARKRDDARAIVGRFTGLYRLPLRIADPHDELMDQTGQLIGRVGDIVRNVPAGQCWRMA